jgi:LPS sulfotransferase NodH
MQPKILFILAEPRSGSSWLLETLNSHRDITLESELYNHAIYEEVKSFHQIEKERLGTCIDYLENKLARLARLHNKYIGCKILINQLRFISPDFPRYFIENYRQAYFIFLLRENAVSAQISLKIAHTHQIWHCTKDEDITKKKVHIHPPEFYNNLERFREQKDTAWKLLEAYEVKRIRLTYEELFADKDAVIKKICTFLHIPAGHIIFSTEKKGNPFRPEEIVENYDEVKEYLKKYPHYYAMLLNAGPVG